MSWTHEVLPNEQHPLSKTSMFFIAIYIEPIILLLFRQQRMHINKYRGTFRMRDFDREVGGRRAEKPLEGWLQGPSPRKFLSSNVD